MSWSGIFWITREGCVAGVATVYRGCRTAAKGHHHETHDGCGPDLSLGHEGSSYVRRII